MPNPSRKGESWSWAIELLAGARLPGFRHSTERFGTRLRVPVSISGNREIIHRDDLSLGVKDCTCDHLFKLPDIAWPVMCFKIGLDFF
jgi:hypothetical protein